jgi:hypothetical protein
MSTSPGSRYAPGMTMDRGERLGLVVAGSGVTATAVGAMLFFAQFLGAFDWDLGELLMRLGVGACLLGSIAVVRVRRRRTV